MTMMKIRQLPRLSILVMMTMETWDHLPYFHYIQRMARREEAEDRAFDVLTQTNFELAYGNDL